ncbi:hypothetical protein KIN20_030988 [Parelaphostrongylus tenuis]|uniref:Secreted protein n=1 Tax=Parelaphostrongylus tenuis TaxID=148309 RepID=A0AAD5R4T6_PARTN|nr:hypothetical protein KIN20_030988 [Parelaphostrongylus tenuis]
MFQHLLSDLLLAITEVLGCGTLPGGPAAMRAWRFNVTGFSLPVAMAFSTAAENTGTGSRHFTKFECSRSTRKTSCNTRLANVILDIVDDAEDDK